MGVAIPTRMHALAYRSKRAHWAFVDINTRLLAPLGITPARLDLLHALADDRNENYGAALGRILGVARQTVWDMVTSLVALGLVRRLPREDRSRVVRLELTAAAHALLDDVFAVFFRSGVALKAAARTLLDAPRDHAKVDAFVASAARIQSSLRRYGMHVVPAVDPDDVDGGAALRPRLRRVFDRALRILRDRFAWLPSEYIVQDLAHPSPGPLESLAF